ncbi:MAG: hypothetical protein EAX95_02700 [Candidatus Thorarchaeota archaeon]|nr:hypothetical protein [Candidatus Thorarchaeota archaeon]
MTILDLPSPLESFTQFILVHINELWDSLVFVGRASAVTVILIGVILFGISVRYNKITGPHLILGGIILAIVVEFFVRFPPDFITNQ